MYLRLLIIVLLTGAALPWVGFCQDAQTNFVNSSKSGAEKRNIAFVRLWHFGDPKASRITVYALKAGGEPLVIGSSVRPGWLGGYRPIVPGEISVGVLDGTVVPDATGRLTQDLRSIASSSPVTINPGDFATVVVRSSGTRPSVELLTYPKAEPSAATRIRVLNYAGAGDTSIRLTSESKATLIWKAADGSPFTYAIPSGAKLARFELVNNTGGKAVTVGSFESELVAGASYSTVIYTDRYGEIAFDVVRDEWTEAEAENADPESRTE